MPPATKRFGKHTYQLYGEYRTKTGAEHGARVARNYGFERVRVIKIGATPAKFDREDYPWAVYADVKSLKGGFNERASKGWVHEGTPKRGEYIKKGYRL